ncbi:MAG: NfeD family protein [bacterium]
MIAGATQLFPLPAWSTGQLVGLVVILMIAGFIMLGAEVFVIPGFGVAGVLGITSLIAGTVLAWLSLSGMWGLVLLFVSLGGTVILLLLFFKSRAGKRLVLDSSLEGSSAVSDEDRRLLGRRGVAYTMLRPAGVAEFGEERVEVETDGDYIAKGAPVIVTAVEMGRVVVEEVSEATSAEAPSGRSNA